MTQPREVPWPVRTLRTEDGMLWVSVDSLRGFRNLMAPAGWPPVYMLLLDHIIKSAMDTDDNGEVIST